MSFKYALFWLKGQTYINIGFFPIILSRKTGRSSLCYKIFKYKIFITEFTFINCYLKFNLQIKTTIYCSVQMWTVYIKSMF